MNKVQPAAEMPLDAYGALQLKFRGNIFVFLSWTNGSRPLIRKAVKQVAEIPARYVRERLQLLKRFLSQISLG